MKKLLLCFSILLFSFSLARAGLLDKDRFDFSGYIKTETSFRIDADANTTLDKFKNFIDLAGQYKIIGDELVFFMHTRYWYDFAYGLNDKLDPAQYYMQHVQRTDWLRDCYLDFIKDRWFLRLGKQQVVWGQADGVAILDRVNPFDLTEYWLPDAADIRIPLWMANINYSPKLNSNIQLLIIPDFEQSTAAPPGAPFTFRSYQLYDSFKKKMEGMGVKVKANIYYPDSPIKIGLQWKDRISDWDYTLNYLYGYDYLARTYTDAVKGRPPRFTEFDFGRRFKIDQLVGGSLNHTFTREGPLKGVTLRADAAVYINEPTYYGDAATGQSAGVNRWNNIFWLMGLDRFFFTKYLASFQFAQYIMEHSDGGVLNPATKRPYETLNTYTNGAQDKLENIFSLKISSHYMNDKLLPEVLWSFTDDNQGRISPKINYEVNDNLWLTLGYHYFYGDPRDSNGEFRNENQVYLNVKYTF
jgi:hypothetical protein